MLDFESEDIDSMDTDEGDDQEPASIGHWTATTPNDVYMVDTPKENNGDNENPIKDKPPEIQPKRQRQRRFSRPRRSKNNNTITEEDNTPDDAENNEDPVETTSDQEEWEDG